MGISMSPLLKNTYTKWFYSGRYGMFEYLIMLFRLMNTPNIFYRVINQILSGLIDSCIVVYLDDILVFNSTNRDHEHNLNAIFKRL